MVNGFIQTHRGFKLKEMISPQVDSAERLNRVTDSGGWLWEPEKQRYLKSLPERAEGFVSKPHIVGVTRELVAERSGSWVGTLFDYHPARFRFTLGEQRLLRVALASWRTSASTVRSYGQPLPGDSASVLFHRERIWFRRIRCC